MYNNRPDWNNTYMDMCEVLSKRSTCLRVQTASIIVKNNVIVSVGYNGTASGQQHCCDYWRQVYDTANTAIGYVAPFTDVEKMCIKITDNNILRPMGCYDDTEDGYMTELKRVRTQPNISYEQFLKTDFFYKYHHEWSNNNELHGEMNAILFAGKNGISLDGGTIYTTYSPCINCAKAIFTSGIRCVIYSEVYKRSTAGIDFLKERRVDIACFN